MLFHGQIGREEPNWGWWEKGWSRQGLRGSSGLLCRVPSVYSRRARSRCSIRGEQGTCSSHLPLGLGCSAQHGSRGKREEKTPAGKQRPGGGVEWLSSGKHAAPDQHRTMWGFNRLLESSLIASLQRVGQKGSHRSNGHTAREKSCLCEVFSAGAVL